MAQNFIACDREQELLLAPNLREWFPEHHLAWFVVDAVDAMDLRSFLAGYREDGWGRAAHDPAMMGWIQLVVATLDLGSCDAQKEPCSRSSCRSGNARHGTSASWVEGTSGPVLDGDRSRGIQR